MPQHPCNLDSAAAGPHRQRVAEAGHRLRAHAGDGATELRKVLDGEVRVQAKFYVPTHFGEWSQQVNSAGDRMLKTSAEKQTKIRFQT